MSRTRVSRRRFAATAAASSFAFTFIPRSVWGANERLNFAGIGVGGKGSSDVAGLSGAGAKYVALCDVDASRASGTFAKHPEAKVYQDFRVMLDKEKGIDGVNVSTPDHVHAIASLTAMQRGKHVYCQKPLTHNIFEARAMTDAAKYYKVQTQMGNQAHADEPIRRAVELIRAGVIGPVREVHAWTNRPIWPQGQKALDERKRLADKSAPGDLDWDLWLGPAANRDYSAAYVPFAWRGWWDFGTGALGDMACHIMDMPYWALQLGAPQSVEATSGGATKETGPDWSTITYQFAARKQNEVGGGTFGAAAGPKAAVEQPAVKFVWYDGSKDGKQNAPYDLLQNVHESGRAPDAAPEQSGAKSGKRNKKGGPLAADDPKRWDLIMVGDAGAMYFNRGNVNWIITPEGRDEDFAKTPKTLPRVVDEDAEFIAACKGGPTALSSVDYAGPFTEMVLLGTLAQRMGKKLDWDAAAMKVTNVSGAEELIKRKYRKGWELPTAPTTKSA